MHMPGHSEDHMSFLLEEEHSLFSGDHVLGWGTTFILEMKDWRGSVLLLRVPCFFSQGEIQVYFLGLPILTHTQNGARNPFHRPSEGSAVPNSCRTPGLQTTAVMFWVASARVPATRRLGALFDLWLRKYAMCKTKAMP